jgi:sulfate/thiosulfate transport system substrate-binding protein
MRRPRRAMRKILGILVAVAAVYGIWFCCSSAGSAAPGTELLNVSYDPTRELWRDLNKVFIDRYRNESGKLLTIRQSHAGSGTQARAVIDGLEADVVSLALWSDTDAIFKHGLIRKGWEERLPNHSLAYYSTIVFVVRKGNPKAIRDWPDLIRQDVEVITPNPKTGGNGKLAFLAAYGAVRHYGQSEDEARQYIEALYHHVPVFDTGARGSTATFAIKGIGDVHLTYENEAKLEVERSAGELEVVYPRASLRTEPFVTLVDVNVDRKGTRAAAEAYLRFLYTPAAQRIIAEHGYRPIDPSVLGEHVRDFPDVQLFAISAIAPGGWDDAHKKFFASGGIMDAICEGS